MLRQIHVEIGRPSGLSEIVTERAGPAGRRRVAQDGLTEVVNDLAKRQRSSPCLVPHVFGVGIDLSCGNLQSTAHPPKPARSPSNLRQQ